MNPLGIEAIQGVLERHGNLEECLLHEMRLVNFGYSVELDFNLVFDVQRKVRPDVLVHPLLITFHLDGVTSMHFEGGLTQSMVDQPELIGWGLSEVAGVEVLADDRGLVLNVAWERERRLSIAFTSATVRPEVKPLES